MTDRLQKDARFWDRAAEKYAAAKIADPAGYETTLAAVRARLKSGDHVLEIGCGTGSTALRLADAVETYLGTDISPEMIRIAREKADTADLTHLSFEVRRSDEVRPDDPAFDAILAFNLLHLVPDPEQTIKSLQGQLKPGGLLISKTPCLTMMNPLIRLLIPLMQIAGKAPGVESFSPDALDAMLERAGFEIIERDWHGQKGKDIRVYRVARKV